MQLVDGIFRLMCELGIWKGEAPAVREPIVSRDGHVSVEQAVSGPGLLGLYRALCALEGQAGMHEQPEAVSTAALAGNDPLASSSD